MTLHASTPLAGRTLVLAVTGSIAAYKAAHLARLLVKAGARVLPVMTRAATSFLGAATLAGITGQPVRVDMWDASVAGELHVDLARAADLVILAPTTADTLARLRQGRADDLVSALVLCATCPVLLAPAMHPRMWAHPAVEDNVRALSSMGRVAWIGPEEGEVASRESGVGRMSEPEAILDRARELLAPGDLVGRRVVVTAGPTYEDVDPVRFLGNTSSGKMGFAVAARARARGAEVLLIAGPVSLDTPRGVERRDVRSALDMQREVAAALVSTAPPVRALVMSAAVADFRPRVRAGEKLKKNAAGVPTLDLVENPDILAGVGAARAGNAPLLVGFALETAEDRLLEYARRKLVEKKVDLVVANLAGASLGRDTNRTLFVTASDPPVPREGTKRDIADRILDWIAAQP